MRSSEVWKKAKGMFRKKKPKTFAELPQEIQSMIWQLCAYNQRVVPLLEDEPYQTTPSFLLACKDAYREGIKGYQLLKTEKHPKSLFNFASDILYISSREPHRELIRHEIEWDNIQNVALEVDSWDSMPKSLGFVYKLPNVKHVHFTCKPALGLQKVVDANEKLYMPPEWDGGRQTTWHLYWRHYWNSRNLKFLSLSVSVWSSDSIKSATWYRASSFATQISSEESVYPNMRSLVSLADYLGITSKICGSFGARCFAQVTLYLASL